MSETNIGPMWATSVQDWADVGSRDWADVVCRDGRYWAEIGPISLGSLGGLSNIKITNVNVLPENTRHYVKGFRYLDLIF